jgi:hypothetical protein
MKRILIATAAVLAYATTAAAGSFGKPCTTEPKEKWMSLDAIQKIISEHGYKVAKAKMKGTCAEVYALDTDGKHIEFFIDPATGNPVGTTLKAPATKGGA